MAKKVVMWPESQMLMYKEGYGGENCKLINGMVGYEVYGSSAYLVDEDWEENNPQGDEELDEDNFCIADDDELLELGFLTDEDFDLFNEEEDDDIDYEDEDYEEDY